MSIITRERIEQLANGNNICKVTREERIELARIALASLEAEPVAYTEKCEITNMQATGLYLRGFPDNSQGRDIALYTAPPAPVSAPDESAVESLATDLMKRIDRITGERHSVATLSSLRVSIVESSRAAMLQGADGNSPVIPDGWVMVPVDATRAMIDAAARVEEDGYDAMHKAMIAAAPQQ